MLRDKSLLRFLAVWFGIITIISISAAVAFAAEKPEIFVQTGHAGPVDFLAVDKNGRYLVSEENSCLKIWEISSGREIKTVNLEVKNGQAGNVYFIDGNRFIVIYSKEAADIFDIYGQKTESINFPKDTYHNYPVISKDRQYLFEQEEPTKIYNMKDGSEISLPELRKFKGFEIYSHGVADLGYGYYGIFHKGESPKGNVDYAIYDDRLNVRMKGSLTITGVSFMSKFKISPDLQHIAYQPSDSSRDISVYNLKTGEQILSYKPRELVKADMGYLNKERLFFSFIPDGRLSVEYNKDNPRKDLLNIARMELVLITPIKNGIYTEKKLVFDDIYSGGYYLRRHYVITDKGMLIAGFANGNVRMTDINKGAEVKSFGVKPVVFNYIYKVDDKLLNIKTDDSITEKRATLTFNLWNIKEGKLEKSESSSTGIYKKKIYPSDEDINRPGALEWEKRGWEKWVLSDPDVYYSKIPKNFLTNDYKNNKEYNNKSQGHFHIFKSNNMNYNASKEGAALVLYNPPTKSEIAKLYAFTDGEWIVITPEGYFNTSANGSRHLNVRVGNNVYGIDQFYAKFYRPELVQLALAGKEIPKGVLITDIAAQKPAPNVQIMSPVTNSSVDQDNVAVTLKITDSGGGIGSVNIYLNGAQVANDTRGIIVKGKASANERIISFTIPLLKGQNEIRAIAFNGENSMESNPALISVISKAVMQKPNLYALVIGINTYNNKSISLTYAVPDATAFAGTLKKIASPLFEKADIRTLTTPEATTKGAITKAFEEVRQLVRPNDLFIFYNASHGMVDVVNGEEQYFLLTSNVRLLSSQHISKDALSHKDLVNLIGSIPAQKKLVILDTCNAGKGGKEIQIALLQQTRGLTDATAVKLLQRAVGSSVFSASADTQQALEGYKGHGLFTYVLLEGLQGKADFKKDGFITVKGLALHTEERVMTLSEEVFKRQQNPMIETGVNDFPIGKVR